MADEAYGVDIRARLQGGGEVRSEATGIAGAIRRLGGDLRESGHQGRQAGKSYEYAAERLHLFGNASVGMRERAFGMASAMIGVTGAVFGVEEVVRRSVEAWGEQRRTMAQTQAVLKSTGGQANVTAEDIGRLGESISRQTGVQGDQVQQAENMLLTFRDVRNEAGRSNDIFSQTTHAAVDMSAAFTSAGKSMTISDAALQLGKALNDPAKGMLRLQRIGVTFTQGQQDQVKALEATGDRLGAQRVILGELTKEFGGSAAAVATPGAKLQATVHQLEETFGRGLQPAIDSVDRSLIGLADRAEPHLKRFSDDFAQAFTAPGLSLGDRLSMVGRDAHTDLGPFVHQLGQDLRAAHLDRELEHAVEWAAPRIAEGAAHAAPRAVAAFAGVWLHTDIWGKLLIGGVALKRLGLLGTLTGRLFGARFAAGAAPAIAATEAGEAGAAAGAGAGGAGLLARLGGGAALLRFGGPIGGFVLGSGLAGGPFGSDAGLSPGSERARLQAMRRQGGPAVPVRYPNGVVVYESPASQRLDPNLHPTTHHHHIYIDGKEVARSVTKHAVDAKARRSR